MIKTISFALSLDKKQASRVSKVFSAPESLLEIIKQQKPSIENKLHASFFLLKNKAFLDKYIAPENRESAINLLTSLLIDWSKEAPEFVSIAFAKNCSMSLKNNRFYVSYLGELTSTEPTAIAKALALGRYQNNFFVSKKDGSFFLDIDFELHEPKEKENPILKSNKPALPIAPCSKNQNKTRKKPVAISADTIIKAFDRKLDQYLKDEWKLALGYKRANFDDLKGWHVQGGAPSLGKKR